MSGSQGEVRVVGARQHNLRDVSLTLPKQKLTVVTGVSGSGKSSLVFDVLAAESQRQLNETFPAFVRTRLPHRGRPEVDRITGLGVAIVVDQERLGGSGRSTVGTATEVWTLLRLLFSRIGRPHVGESTAFSFNDPRGMCPRCEGLGTAIDIDVDELLDDSRSLNDGALTFPTFEPGGWRWKRYALSGLFDPDVPVRTWSAERRELLLHAEPRRLADPPEGYPRSGHYLGVVPRFRRAFLAEGRESMQRRAEIERVVRAVRCPECHGQRLNAAARRSKVGGHTIGSLATREVRELPGLLRPIDAPEAVPILEALTERVDALVTVGLGYLTLDRTTPTLSGGESQRVKLVKHLGSSLTDLTYVLDEPSVGLHPEDVGRLVDLLRTLRDRGNTVLVVEHDPDVIACADHVVDLGPGPGADGGTVTYQGTVAGLRRSATVTGHQLRHRPAVKTASREPTGWVKVRRARANNLRELSVDVPLGVLAVVTGVAGSGKSTLVTSVLPPLLPGVVTIDQSAPRGVRRSSVATYLGVAEPLRAHLAAVTGAPAGLFSRNSGGACPECAGKGELTTDLAYLEDVTVRCETCAGTGFSAAALAHRVDGRTIADVLALTALDAREALAGAVPDPPLRRLHDVGLGYLTLGQSLATLSGGERQRLKLADALTDEPGTVYVVDEPTAGLHMADVGRLVGALDALVDRGNSLVVVEHDLDVVAAADWVLDLGPGAGSDGGRLVYSGPPAGLAAADTPTGRHLARATS